jgi:hypothetical protein
MNKILFFLLLFCITSNTFGQTVLNENHGGTSQSSYAKGDILHASAANTLSKLTIGSTGNVLTVSGGDVVWSSTGGDVTLAGENYLTLSSQIITAHAVDLSGTNATGILAAARFPVLTGDVTTSSGSLATTWAASTVLSSHLVDFETPTGTVDGSNAVFTTANTVLAAHIHVYLNGQVQDPAGGDYTFSAGNTITFTSGAKPQTGDKIRVCYWK